MDIRVQWKDRDRTIPATFDVSKKTKTNHWGTELHGFWMPNIYGSPPGSVTFYLEEAARTALKNAFDELLENDGLVILLTEAHRDYDTQYKAWKEKPNLAVSPEVSKHPRGKAVDIGVTTKRSVFGRQATRRHTEIRTSWPRLLKRTAGFAP
jgi:hypothetical protein